MIPKFDDDTALLLIDVQRGVDDLQHWGGSTGRRNNPNAEQVMADLLAMWRERVSLLPSRGTTREKMHHR
jgi:hypothetical protein